MTLAEALSTRCYVFSEPHLGGYRLVIGFASLAEVGAAHEAVATSPAENSADGDTGSERSEHREDLNSISPPPDRGRADLPRDQGACVQVEGLRRAVDLAKDRQLAWQKAWGDDRAATDLHNALPGLWAAIDATLDRLVQVEAERAAWKAEHYRMLELAQSRAAERDAARKALEEARDLLLERLRGSPARSPSHNARLVIDQALSDLKEMGE